MWLPTQAQVDAASRHAISIAGTAIVIFGLQAKGVSLDQVKDVIGALGSTVNSIVVLLGALAPLYALLKASSTASPTSQIQAVKNIATGPASSTAVDAQAALIHATSTIAADPSIPTSKAAQQVINTIVAKA